MKLKEFLNQINLRLKENMDKEVIKTDYRSYDTIKGRRVIEEHDLRGIMGDIEPNYIIGHPNVDNGVNMRFLDINFKLKRKKSGLIGYNFTDRLTYVEIDIIPNFENAKELLEMELIDIKNMKENKEEQIRINRINKEENKIVEIKEKLSKYNITIEEMRNILYDYDRLSYDNRNRVK